MECEEVSKRLWEYLDEELNAKESQSVAQHLDGCPWCHRSYCSGRAFLGVLARQRHACAAPVSLVVRIRRLINV